MTQSSVSDNEKPGETASDCTRSPGCECRPESSEGSHFGRASVEWGICEFIRTTSVFTLSEISASVSQQVAVAEWELYGHLHRMRTKGLIDYRYSEGNYVAVVLQGASK